MELRGWKGGRVEYHKEEEQSVFVIEELLRGERRGVPPASGPSTVHNMLGE